MSVKELEAQRAELLPDRIEMRRRKRRHRTPISYEPGQFACLAVVGYYPPDHPCSYPNGLLGQG